MKTRTMVLCFALTVVLASTVQAGLVVTCTNCSEKLIQILDRVTNVEELATLAADYEESVAQTMHQMQMVANQLDQYSNMVQNTIKLPQTLLNKITGDFTELAGLTRSIQNQVGDVVALGNLFDEIYADRNFLNNLATAQGSGIELANEQYFEKWNDWSDQVERASKAVFQVSGQQLDDLIQDADAFDQHIASLLSTPEGQVQALDAGNQLAALQIEEARQLRTLLLTATQAQAQESMKAERLEELRAQWWKDATCTDKLEGKVGIKNAQPDPF